MGKGVRKVIELTPEEFKARRESRERGKIKDSIREELVILSLKKREATALGFSSLASKYAARIEKLNKKLEG